MENIHIVAAELARIVPELAADAGNRQTTIENLLRPVFEERDAALRGVVLPQMETDERGTKGE